MGKRLERLLTGRGRFVDDVDFPDLLHAKVLRSPWAHARIVSVDTQGAAGSPGVVAIYTAATLDYRLPKLKPIPMRLGKRPELEQFCQWPLARNVVRYVGDPVAFVVATDPYLAEDALERIDVHYEPLTPVLAMDPAKEDSPELCATRFDMAEGDVDDAFERADFTVNGRFVVQRHYASPIETRGLVARVDPESGVLTLWGDTKVPQFNRTVLAERLSCDVSSIRFMATDVGGGFGARGEFYPENFLVPYAALELGRPVKWIEDRRENLCTMNHSREVAITLELAAAADGEILGLRAVVDSDIGAYVRTHGALVPTMTAALLVGPYAVPASFLRVRCWLTHKTGAGTYRGPGYFESTFARERLLDRLAREVGIDPVDLRRRNLVPHSRMPYRLSDGAIHLGDKEPIIYDSGDFARALEVATEKINEKCGMWSGRGEDGRYYGTGFACFVEPTGFGPKESARVIIERGRAWVEVGTSSLGQSHESLLAGICADYLGLPVERVDVRWGDSDFGIDSRGTFGSRVAVMTGSAVAIAASRLRARLLGEGLQSGEWRGPSELHIHRAETVKPVLAAIDGGRAEGLSETGSIFSQKAFSYGAHAARVALDPETGATTVIAYVVAEDVGRILDHDGLEGQVIGAVVQGLGGTFLEALRDDEQGQPLTSLADYCLPTAQWVPPIESLLLEEYPTYLNPLGAKGGGEGGIIATGAAVTNALVDALRPLDIEFDTLPLSPERVFLAVQKALDRKNEPSTV